MSRDEEFLRWIDVAQDDYDAAILLAQAHKPLLEIVCFHCQQSAEKLLKSFIVKNSGEIKKTHDLVEILKKCTEIDSEFEKLKQRCIDLTDYSVEIRYPYPYEINDADMRKAIDDLEVLRAFVLAKVEE
ncbi:MAG: HEPN domain-containing protein [Spirochaetales bacterium]|nr:HEPN domain-containing protein [Spirochaetales bacterium]